MDFRKGGMKKDCLTDSIRMAVDQNLKAIHETITENLYKVLGLKPRELKTVEKFMTKDIKGVPQKGYLYNYERQLGPIKTRIRVKVDPKGRLIDAIQTK